MTHHAVVANRWQRLLVVCIAVTLAVPFLVQAAPPYHLAVLPVPEESAVPIRAIVAEPGGGYSVFLASGQVLGFDKTNKLVEKYASPLLESGDHSASFRVVARAGGHVVFREDHGLRIVNLLDQYPIRRACVQQTLGGDRKLTVFYTNRLNVAFHDHEPDVAGGYWARGQHGQVTRFQADCGQQVLFVSNDQIAGVAAHPLKLAAFADTYTGILFMVDAGGVVWERDLPGFHDRLWYSDMGVVVVGSGVAVVPYALADGRYRLAAFNQSGDLLWTYDGDDSPNRLLAYDSGLIAIGSSNIKFLTPGGVEKWQEAIPSAPHAVVASRRSDKHAWIRVTADQVFGTTEVVALRLDQGRVASWELDFHQHPISGRDDGSVFLVDEPSGWINLPASELWHARLDQQIISINVAGSTPHHRVVRLLSDDQGELAIGLGKTHWTLHSLDKVLGRRWSVSRSFETDVGIEPVFQLVASAENICVLVERSSALALHCVKRKDGTTLFESVSWSGYGGHVRPSIENEIEIIHVGASVNDKVRRTRIGLDGQFIESGATLPHDILAAQFELLEVLFPESGHTVVVTKSASGVITAFVFDAGMPTGQQPVIIKSPSNWWPWESLQDGRLLTYSVGHGHFTIAGSSEPYAAYQYVMHRVMSFSLDSGGLQWQTEFEEFVEGRKHALIPSRDGWLVGQVGIHGARLVHLDALSGQTLFHRVIPLDESVLGYDFPGAESLTRVSPHGDGFVIVSPMPSGTRLLWFDGRNGELAASVTAPVYVNDPIDPVITDADGSVLVAGSASDASYPGPALIKTDPKSRKAATNKPVANMAGAWFDPTTSGQGWFIDVFEAEQMIFGAWFTFERQGTMDARGLRWYTMLGDFPGSDGIARLKLYLNTGGAFEAYPSTDPVHVGDINVWQTISGGLQMDVRMYGSAGVLRTGLDLVPVLPAGDAAGVQHWFDPDIAGQGLLLAQALESSGPLFAGWFTYDVNGKQDDYTHQHWFTALGGETDQNGYRVATIHRTVGGSLGTTATNNVSAVGQLRMKLLACDRLKFEYNFDSSDLAGSFAGLGGERILRPITGCVGQ